MARTTVLDQALQRLPQDIDRIPGIASLTDALPIADVLFGGAMLLVVVIVHAVGIKLATNYIRRRSAVILTSRSSWRVDVMFGVSISMLLALHIVETLIWTAALVYSGLIDDWRAAGFFAANTYTTIGYGSFLLPPKWEMLAPIIAISGLFTFGWTGSVLVGFVSSMNVLREKIDVAMQGRGNPDDAQ